MLKKFASNSLFYLLGMVLNRGLAFLLLPLYTKHLTPADYGVLAICGTTTILAMTITLSVDSALPLLYSKLDEHEFKKLLTTVWAWFLIVPLLFIVIVDIGGSQVAAILLAEVAWDPYLRLAVWIAYFSIPSTMVLSLLMGEQKAREYAVFTVASFLVTTLLLIYFVAVRRQGALGSLRGQIIAAVVIAVVSHLIVLKRSWPLRAPWISRKHLVAALRLCVPFMPHVLSLWLLNVSDRWVLSYFVDLSAIGLYSLAYTLGMVVPMFGTAMISAYSPIYYRRAADESFRSQLPRLLCLYLLVHTWIALAISLLAPEILRLMTQPAYYQAAALVPWIAAGYWFVVGVYQLSFAVISHHGRSEWTILLTGPPAITNLVLNWLFVPRYGIWAAAMSTLLTLFLMAGLALFFSRRLDKLPYSWKAIGQMVAVAVATGWVGLTWLSLSNLSLAVLTKVLLLVLTGIWMARISGITLNEVWALTRRTGRTKPVAV